MLFNGVLTGYCVKKHTELGPICCVLLVRGFFVEVLLGIFLVSSF